MRLNWLVAAYALLCTIVVVQDVRGSQCSEPLGNADQTNYTAVDNDIFILDLDHPAQCDGTVENVSYCAYRPSPSSSLFASQFFFSLFRAYLAVFRIQENDVYARVTEFARFSPSQLITTELDDFWCFEQSGQTPLTVQTGDVLGVCQVDPGLFFRRLNVIGTGAPSGNSLYVAEADMDCDRTLSVNIEDGSFQILEGYVMHLHANIMINNPPTITTETTVISSSSAKTVTGTSTSATTTATSATTTATSTSATTATSPSTTNEPVVVTRTSESVSALEEHLTSISSDSSPYSTASHGETITTSATMQLQVRPTATGLMTMPALTTTRVVTNPSMVIGGSVGTVVLLVALCAVGIGVIAGVIVWRRKNIYSNYAVSQSQNIQVSIPDQINGRQANMESAFITEEMAYEEIELHITRTEKPPYKNAQRNTTHDDQHCAVTEAEYADVSTHVEDTEYAEIDVNVKCTENISYRKHKGYFITKNVSYDRTAKCGDQVDTIQLDDGEDTCAESTGYFVTENVSYDRTTKCGDQVDTIQLDDGEDTCAESTAYTEIDIEPSRAEYYAKPVCTPGNTPECTGRQETEGIEHDYTTVDDYEFMP